MLGLPARPTGTPVKYLVGAAGILALLASPADGAPSAVGATAGSEPDYQSASLRFLESTPGRPSGYRVRIDYVNPDDPEAKPPSVRKVVEIFPRGTRVDTGAPALCTASDAELMLQGQAACPPGSVVGTGFIRLDTGAPEPGRFLREDVTFLNNTDELIYLTEDRENAARTVVRARISGRRVVTDAPFLPGAAPDGTAIDVVRGEFPQLVRTRDGRQRAYVRTPGECAARGFWVAKVRFVYEDGTTQTERTRSRCTA